MLMPRSKVKLEQFLPHIMLMVQGDSRPALPEAVALSSIRNACIEFSRDTGIITRTERINTQPNMFTYPLVFDTDDEELHTVARVEDARGELPFIHDDSCVTFQFQPTEGCLEVRFTVHPTRTCCQVDEVLHDDWYEAIVDKVMTELHLMPQQPWTSGSGHDRRRISYDKHVRRAKNLIAQKFSRQHQTVPRNRSYY